MSWTGITAIIGSVFGFFAFVKYFLLSTIRIEENAFKTLYDLYRKNHRTFVIEEEMVSEQAHPSIYDAIYFVSDLPFLRVSHTERLLTAGWSGKENLTTITCFRWQKRRLVALLRNKVEEAQLNEVGIPIEVVLPNYTDKIGMIKRIEIPPLVDEEVWKDVEEDFEEVMVKRTRNKTGAILYGPPGNGKTSFIRRLAIKYKVPIKIIVFSPEYTNLDILRIFSRINGRCIVLFEDFDNHFDLRKCIIGGGKDLVAKFTFDSILNGLDGIYNSHEGVAFFMTVNHLDKVDPAMKNRPSRFRFVREFPNPSRTMIERLVPNYASKIEDGVLNLDQLVQLRERHDKGQAFEDTPYEEFIRSTKTCEVSGTVVEHQPPPTFGTDGTPTAMITV